MYLTFISLFTISCFKEQNRQQNIKVNSCNYDNDRMMKMIICVIVSTRRPPYTHFFQSSYLTTHTIIDDQTLKTLHIILEVVV
jgi:hypothetical protein